MTREQMEALCRRILSMSTADGAYLYILHTVRSVTRLASDQVRSADDGDTLNVFLGASYGNGCFLSVQTNQVDDEALRALVARADALGTAAGPPQQLLVRQWDEQDAYMPVQLWHSSSVDAITSARETVIPPMIQTVRQHQLQTSGFIGIMARSEAILTKEGIHAFYEETDCEVSITARPADGTNSGWAGAAARDWRTLDVEQVAAAAAAIADRGRSPQAVEPGRRTAILGPGAVVQLMRFFALHFSGGWADKGQSGFSHVNGRHISIKWRQQLFDPRVNVTTDPADPDGGFRPWFQQGYADRPTIWVDRGVLKTLARGIGSIASGKPYAEMPFGLRLHGGPTTLDAMISQCDEGIYVNRVSGLECIDWSSGMITGTTRDGCFLIKNGKIDRSTKNFRFLMSPFFLLNNIIAIGPTARTAFGYTPPTIQEQSREVGDPVMSIWDWPRRPMIVPPLMVRDFNFNALSDAV